MSTLQLSQDLIYWGKVFESAVKITENVRQMESIKEAVKAVLKLANDIDFRDVKLQEAIFKLEEACLPTNIALCAYSEPMKQRISSLEQCYKRIILSNQITGENISDIEAELCECAKLCTEYRKLLDKFLQDTTRVRELFEKAIDSANNQANAAGRSASDTRSWGLGASAAWAGIAAIFGISIAILGAPVTVVAAVGTAGCVGFAAGCYGTLLSAASLDEQARKFGEASAALQSYADTLKDLIQKTSTGPVALSDDLRKSLTHVLQMYSKFHEKVDEANGLRQDNAELQSRINQLNRREQEKEDEIERLNRKIARLTANERNTD